MFQAAWVVVEWPEEGRPAARRDDVVARVVRNRMTGKPWQVPGAASIVTTVTMFPRHVFPRHVVPRHVVPGEEVLRCMDVSSPDG